METIFKHIGYQISNSKQGKKFEFYVIKNSDGSPRWIIPTKNTTPDFLKFYNVNSYKSKVFSAFFKLIYILKIQFIFLKKVTLYLESTKNPVFDIYNSQWSLFTGTIGPNNKIIVFKNENKINSFFKIATTPISKEIINQEYKTLQLLSQNEYYNTSFPRILQYNENFIELSDISEGLSRFSELNSQLLNSISEISKINSRVISFNEFKEIHHFEEILHQLKTQSKIPSGIIKKLKCLIGYFEDENIELTFSHGDFTSWNSYGSKKQVGVYDWELASNDRPLGFDAFHFIIQQNILINRNPWINIREEIYNSIQEINIQKWSNNNEISINKYLSLYLLTNCIYYLNIYSKQEKWHDQINWLINTWNDAISDVLKTFKVNRGLLITDLFDFLKYKKYAALKFPNIEPENLSEFSDVDICILKKDKTEIYNFIDNHPLISDYTISSKSFMSNYNIQLIDGSFLSLDLIWKFKRTKWVFLDSSELLKNAITNNFDVKVPNNSKLARYVGYFYGLNHAKIPDKYLYLKEYLTDSKSDELLKNHYENQPESIKHIYKSIIIKKENQGVKKIYNTLQYYFDAFKQILKNKGMIITFSGVDGAGKSTIIEKVKHLCEKKYRKKVVVIRHRPSILPILSAITKGKEQAEKDAASTLPRQGNNQNKLSSFIRFGYYYVDYLFGQFYVNFKYKYRGYVVLYDRYYFDFILDSKRSNILISSSFVKFLYRFILTPDINLFLYADPETILSRKKELSEETIVELTSKYKSLFDELESRKLNKNYICIKNIVLDETLNTIDLEINRKIK